MGLASGGGIAALFPGQGAQQVGMGMALCQDFALARQIFEEASDAIRLDLRKLCQDGPESDLTLTENLQPALVTVSTAAFRVAQAEAGFEPTFAAGHSLGEYSALVAAGALSFAQAVAWVRERGRAMQQAVPANQGGMAAVIGLEDEAVSALCALAQDLALKRVETLSPRDRPELAPVCEPANYNAPGQIAVAGTTEAIESLTIAAASGDPRFTRAKVMKLPVSAPFHCSLMQPAREHMAALFKKAPTPPAPPAFAYVANRTARITREPGVIFDLLVEQVDHPVLWKQSVERLFENGVTRFVEFGPGKVLSGLVKRIHAASPPEKVPQAIELLQMNEASGLEFLRKGVIRA